MSEIVPFLDGLPPWVLILVVITVTAAYLARAVAESSDTWAKILGPPGRRWRARANRRATREAADIRMLKRQVSNLMARDAERDRRDAERDKFEARLRLYLAYDADWHFRARLAAAGAGTRLPEHLSFIEWEATGS